MSHHMAIHDRREMECKDCGKKVSGLKSLLNHSKTHQKWSCNHCGKEIPLNSRSSHMKKCITGPEFKCEVCPYVTEQANNLKRHKGKHQKEKKEKEIICCKQCDKTFQFKHHLTQHIKYFDLAGKTLRHTNGEFVE